MVSKPRRRSPRKVGVLVIPLVALYLVVLCLLVERWRGQYALSRWKQQMIAKGEVFEPRRIWPAPSPQGVAFSNELQKAVAELPPGLNRYAGQIAAIVIQQPGMARRGSQEPIPILEGQSDPKNTWQDLADQVERAQPALQSLHRILSTPPGDVGYDVAGMLEQFGIPNFVSIRRTAQALQAAAISDLHRNDLARAKENLVALAAFRKLYANDPWLVAFMIRVAILGLSTDTAWDALQANGWTDDQLAELQQAFQCDEFLAQLPRTLEAERASRLFEYNWFASHSYLGWVARYEPIYQSFGLNVAVTPQVVATRRFREWVSHPLWKFAWADQEKGEYLKNSQCELDVVREAVKSGSWKQLNSRIETIQGQYRAPFASWRFYLELPMPQHVISPVQTHQYPYSQYSRAWLITMKNVTLNQMLITAIAMKRYEARYHKTPPTLQALVPEFLPQAPLDFMDGQPLRYKVRRDGTCCLYSVGQNTEDNQGDSTPQTSNPQRPSAWDGRDWVWPRVALSH